MQSLRQSFAALSVRASAAPLRSGLIAAQLPRTTFQARSFAVSTPAQSWLLPKSGDHGSTRKGRPRVQTGGSTRGTTVVWGDYGMRMTDHHRRLTALQLRNAEETIKKKLRGMKYRIYTRIAANIPVYTKGNETRMGTGKGSMDFWASRVHVSRVIIELKGDIHEQIVKDAFRIAAAKLPGNYEMVKKGDVPMMGTIKLTPENVQKLIARKGVPIGPLQKYIKEQAAAAAAAAPVAAA
ncbi:50S ribosomal protein L16 [Tricharina praecox]|uniref:50S ribosomal protein L16 n=1 Tax=Tricharina praecox TaxID=43433 RepID=UPI0022204142|nr:50S ribosomal protein L16 [Tricharina praecox]KAI5855895.1 50S ribosomal protein L16 [Tricharina praecox]